MQEVYEAEYKRILGTDEVPERLMEFHKKLKSRSDIIDITRLDIKLLPLIVAIYECFEMKPAEQKSTTSVKSDSKSFDFDASSKLQVSKKEKAGSGK